MSRRVDGRKSGVRDGRLVYRPTLGLLAVVLGFVLLIGTGLALAAEGDGGDSSSSPASVPPSPAGEEIPELRTATSRTFGFPDGSREARIFEAPVNYVGEEGDWKPIEEGFEQGPGGSLTNGENGFDLRLPERMGAGAVRLTDEDRWVSYRLLGGATGIVDLHD